jgi:Polyketide cyclase / dehydrase and lipid transport.
MWESEHSEETAAPAGAVWTILADAEGWPIWNPGYSKARLDGPLAAGATGEVTLANGMERKFDVYQVKDSTFFSYGGTMPGARQEFLQRVERLGDGRTRVTLGHTIKGPASLLYGLLFGRVIRGYLPTAVRQLVAKAERESIATQG